jgi:hypothetical protein
LENDVVLQDFEEKALSERLVSTVQAAVQRALRNLFMQPIVDSVFEMQGICSPGPVGITVNISTRHDVGWR